MPSIDGHEILGELGRGGMGVVYRARDPQVDREVAVKVLDERTPGSEATERFIREVRLAARAGDHPGVARIHRAGSLPDGRLYYVMEIVPGRSLRERLAGGALDPREATRIVALAAEAVQHAHERGVVHRDIKPANLILDADDRPRPLAEATRVTETGQLLGTPVYMAPEQIEDAASVGPSTDVYALGAVLWACLVGRPPYDPSSSHWQVIHDVCEADRPRLDEVAPDLPDDLVAIAEAAMALDPAGRPGSAGDLAELLRGWLRGEEVRVRAPRRSRGPGRLGSIAGVLGFAGIIGLAVALLGPPFGGSEEDEGPTSPRSAASPDAGPGPSPGEVRGRREEEVAALREVLRDPAEVGPRIAASVAALLPGEDDPVDPFIRWEEAERASLGALLEGREEPAADPEAAREALDALAKLADDGVRGARAAWTAAAAVLGEEGQALRERGEREVPAVRLVRARLRLVAGELDEAAHLLRSLAPDAPDDARHASFLRAILRFLRGDPSGSGAAIDRAGRLADRPEGLRLRALLVRLGGSSRTPEVTLGYLRTSKDLASDSSQESLRNDLLRFLEEEGVGSGPRRPSLVSLEVRTLVDHGRFGEAVHRIREPPDPGPELRAARVRMLDLLLRGRAVGDRSARFNLRDDEQDRFESFLPRRAIDETTIREEARSLRRLDPTRAAARAALARWEVPREDEGLARGLEALGFGRARGLLDAHLRGLVRRGHLEEQGPATLIWQAWATHLERPSGVAGRAVASLDGPWVGEVFSPPGWFEGRPRAPFDSVTFAGLEGISEKVETSAFRSGLPVPLRLALAELLLALAGDSGRDRLARLARRHARIGLGRLEAAGHPAIDARLLMARVRAVLDETDRAATRLREVLEWLEREDRPDLPSRGDLARYRDVTRVATDLGRDGLARRAGRNADGDEGMRARFFRQWESQIRADRRELAVEPGLAYARLDADRVGVIRPLIDPLESRGRTEAAFRLVIRRLVAGDRDHLHRLTLGAGMWFRSGESAPPARPAESFEDLLAEASRSVLLRTASTERILRGLGQLTDLLLAGVAPGPVLALRGWARFRLGDVRGALGDARAALDASGEGPDRKRREEYRRFPRLVAGVACLELGRSGRAVEHLAEVDRGWLRRAWHVPALQPGIEVLRRERGTREDLDRALPDPVGPAEGGR